MNKYDDTGFFEKYKEMARSKYGLEAAGEWSTMRKMLPGFSGKTVLDIGCGYGWLSLYAVENGATSVIGIDNSFKMLEVAEEKKKQLGDKAERIEYKNMSIEEMNFPQGTFDVVISSLAFHYASSFDDVVNKVTRFLTKDGDFVFSVEHPIFTAFGTGDWIYDDKQQPDHWPVDNYFSEGKRQTNFLGCDVQKYHKTLTTYINALVKGGVFRLTQVIEPLPEPDMLAKMPDEARRPMMLLVAAKKSSL